MTHKLTADGAAVVAPEYHWIPIDARTPRGATLLLINKSANRMQSGILTAGEKFFDHWAPCPTFPKEPK